MTIAVLGMGKTGESICRHFSRQGEKVWGIDDRKDLGLVEGCERIFQGGDLPSLNQIERFFISPGVSPDHPAARAAQNQGLTLEGELDLAFSLSRVPVIAITGTNGKSTTTSLLGAMLQQEGWNVGVGGNLGTPYLDLVGQNQDFRYFVLEVSSFQLETTREFRPHVSVLLNLSDDHLDRHASLSDYLQAKAKIFAFQNSEDFAVYNDDDLRVLEAIEGVVSRRVPFSTAKKVKGVFADENGIHWAPNGTILSSFSLKHSQLRGLHNLENISAALAAAKIVGASDENLQKAMDSFAGLPHRIQPVATIQGVQYFDDSKATNVGAVVMSLASFDGDVVIILGGVDKGGDYRPLRPLLKAKARAALVLGEARDIILEALEGSTELIPVSGMEEAVQRAYQLAPPGGVVLLSPACSSFDMYKNYHERGLDFQNLVKQLG